MYFHNDFKLFTGLSKYQYGKLNIDVFKQVSVHTTRG